MISDFIKKYDLPSYRLQQFNQAFYQRLINSFDDLTTWPKDVRENLKKEVEFSSLKKETEQVSRDRNTIKTLFSLKSNPNHKLEAVLMRFKDGRNSVCVSCMVGCPLACEFCATGKMGHQANLSAAEIVDQVMYFARELKKRNAKVTNVIFMGMGEPLLNYSQVMKAVDILKDPEKFALSQRRVVISTAGVISGLIQLVESDFGGRLAISLHAPTQSLREQIMPIARTNPLDKLMETVEMFMAKTNKRVTFEYILIKGVNDKERHAIKLAKLLKGKLAHVNLIPINPVSGSNFTKPIEAQIKRFAKVLERNRIPHSVRVTMGDDIKAACGQLAGKE